MIYCCFVNITYKTDKKNLLPSEISDQAGNNPCSGYYKDRILSSVFVNRYFGKYLPSFCIKNVDTYFISFPILVRQGD